MWKVDKQIINVFDTYPSYWKEPFNIVSQVTLESSSDLFKEASRLMNSTISPTGHNNRYGLVPGLNIDPKYFQLEKVIMIQNPQLWKNYILRKMIIRDRHSGTVENTPSSLHLIKYPPLVALLDKTVNEYYMFHGTKEEIATIITKDGFNERVAKEGGMFGFAAYFADRSSKSNQYIPCTTCGKGAIGAIYTKCDCKPENIKEPYCMLISRVILGNPFICIDYDEELFKSKDKENGPLKVLETKEQKMFDSVFAETKAIGNGKTSLQYREVAIYDPGQCYPEFIVYFRRLAETPKEK